MTMYAMAGYSAGAYGTFLKCVYERNIAEQDEEMNAKRDGWQEGWIIREMHSENKKNNNAFLYTSDNGTWYK